MRVFLLLLLCPLALHAQTPGSCEPGRATALLDANDVEARLFNTGALFFGEGSTSGDGYLVPAASGTSPVFAADLWVGGKVNGELRVAAAQYTRFEFWPGPLLEGAALPNPSDCSAYDRIFVVSRDDVARYLETGEMTDDLRDWPAAWGAPVLDGDGDPNNYDLEAGDQPAIYGDQTAWWVMNDVGNAHEETESDPLGIEVQVTAFASERGPVMIQQATYYRYRIRNRSAHAIDSLYVSLFSDPDLGNPLDDYIGSDTTLSMGFVYNGDDLDEGSYGYGVPPAHGYAVVQGPVGLPNGRDDDRDGAVDEPGERLGMTVFNHGLNIPQGPVDPPPCMFAHYDLLRGLHCTGIPITEGGNGYNTGGPVTTFAYSGDPVVEAYWSEVNTDGQGSANAPGDRVVVVSTGPFRLAPGETEEVVFALPFAQGTSHLDSVTELRGAAGIVRNAWDTGFFAPQVVAVEPPLPEVPGAVELSVPVPNPFTDRLTVRYSLPDAMPARITLLDVLGREVARLASGSQSAGPHEAELDTRRLPAGLYLVRFEVGTEARTFTVVKAR